ncbi:MAG: 3-dehydroquinate synthase [Aureispira sp.]
MIDLLDYPIAFETAAFVQLNELLRHAQYSKVVVLLDDNTKQYCWPILQQALQAWAPATLVVPAGEQHKNITTCQHIWQQLMALKIDRKALLINLGGGVLGDMGGFCASTFKRGLDFIQIPTTLLAQVDASVGGKLGVDFEGVKNSVGLFAAPKAVYLHPAFFQTLPKEELYSGYAEMIKHALLQQTTHWRAFLPTHFPPQDWQESIEASIGVKKAIVAQDPLEQGMRKQLNLGHTIGHAVESLSWETQQPLLHGEAVALGTLMAAYLSWRLLDWPLEELQKLNDYIRSLYTSYDLSMLDLEAIWQLVLQDKKNSHQQVSFTLLQANGSVAINQAVSKALVEEALLYYQSNQLPTL